jgi:hypothetical protein
MVAHRRMTGPVSALLLALCCLVAGGWSVVMAEPEAPVQDVVRRSEFERQLISRRYTYELLDAALERSVARYGPYRVEPAMTELTTARLRREAVKGDLVNVVVLEPLDEDLIPIDIPLDKGLLGYRIASIRASDRGRVAKVRNIADLRHLRIGASGGTTAAILRHNGMDVMTVGDPRLLMSMLERGRFDLFPRGATVVAAIHHEDAKAYPGLAIDQHLLIHFPYAQYAYVSKSAPRLAERIRYGLQEMQKDGSFDQHFDKYFAQTIADFRFSKRTVIELENPFLPAWAKIPPLEWRSSVAAQSR